MNKRIVLNFLGNICFLEAGLLLIPILVSVIYQEPLHTIMAFVYTIFLLVASGLFLRLFRPSQVKYTLKEGFAITALSWLVLSFFGGLPFVFAGEIPSVVDATFEMASGFTTTGASILTDVEALSQSFLFWRSFSHLIGGMGILVFAFAFAPQMGEGSVNIMKAEVPGPQFGKLVAKTKNSALINYKIYLVMTMVLIFILKLTGLNFFDAIIHAFGAAGTGGFSNKAASVGAFENPAAEYVLAIAMVLFGVNFNLYFYLLSRRIRDFFKNEELRLYMVILIGSVVFIMMNLSNQYENFEALFRDSLFTVTTIISTTGYATVDFGQWPLFAHIVLLVIMFTGSMAGSTAGGIKISRILIYLKGIRREVKLATQPRRVLPIRVDGKPLTEQYIQSAFIYLGIYLLLFLAGVMAIAISQNDFMTAFSSISATLNNIGPGMSLVGPTENYAGFNVFSKLLLTAYMLIGRLEIYPVLILFQANLWRTRH